MSDTVPSQHSLDLLLKKGIEEINVHGADEFVVLVGCTGSGKSSFLKFLVKDETLRIEANREKDCIFVDGEATIGSDDCLVSKTLLPNLQIDAESGLVVLDCAGFEDNRSAEHDLIAAFLNKMILEKAKRFKLVIVENHEKLRINADRNAFMNVISHVSGLLKFNHRSFENSICLVATKVEQFHKSDDDLVQFIKEFLSDVMQNIEGKFGTNPSSADESIKLDILRFLLGNNRIGLFRRPTEVANPLWNLVPLQQNFKNLREMIFEDMRFSPDDCGKFNVVVAPRTEIWITDTLIGNTIAEMNDLLASITDTIYKSISIVLEGDGRKLEEKLIAIAEVGELTVTMLSSIKSLEDLEDYANREGLVQKATLEDLRFLALKLTFLFSVVGKDGTEVQNMIASLNGGREAIISKVKAIVNANKFIVDLGKNAVSPEVRLANDECLQLFDELSCENFRSKMTNLRKMGFSEQIATAAVNLSGISESQLCDLKALILEKNRNVVASNWKDGCLLVLGKFVFLSQVLNEIKRGSQEAKQVVVAATQQIYIDCDLDLMNTHLSLVAPTIENLETKRTITLKGEDGVSYDNKQAASSTSGDCRGKNGKHGEPGRRSGSFTLISLDVLRPSLLEVWSTGGNGGNGQDGGDGNNVPECLPPTLEVIDGPITEMFDPIAYVKQFCETKGYRTTITNIKHEYPVLVLVALPHISFDLELENYPVTRPTAGGRGGDGGPPAVAGEITIKINNHAAKNCLLINTATGSYGKPGSEGISGSNAKGKYKKLKCMYRSFGTILWRVTVDELLDSGDCDYNDIEFDETEDTSDEEDENRRPHYKFSKGLMTTEKIENALEDYATSYGFDKDPNYKAFINFM